MGRGTQCVLRTGQRHHRKDRRVQGQYNGVDHTSLCRQLHRGASGNQLPPPAWPSRKLWQERTTRQRGSAGHSYTQRILSALRRHRHEQRRVGLQLMGEGICPYLELQAPHTDGRRLDCESAQLLERRQEVSQRPPRGCASGRIRRLEGGTCQHDGLPRRRRDRIMVQDQLQSGETIHC